ncbi:phosphoserine aminotransferase [Hyphomicrobium denitrificans 1NES1]|uniref:phosphoserine transaminase n=1 Tax=Hyphomicrobium denitrificans 1NES1 TaxID=670307 RepID=N0B414_9HYPH|nr:phosphoserine transaminase [Hyphomicrobium denitrificans]AGK56932.1 phosphoserine aminotransferase [Hyphomicrobium denitrificans 1NES1]
MITEEPPGLWPANACFSSGPCSKHPGWSFEALKTALVGRSHRAKEPKARLKRAIDETREILGIPALHQLGIVPASDTGALEMALWSLLGARGVDILAWESFGEGWVSDVVKELKIEGARTLRADYGDIADLAAVNFDNDVVFTWNGTTSGVRVPNSDWIAADRKGLTICDATSAAFAQRLDWEKLDVMTFSWQKVLGGEAAHGMIVLGPRAVERLQTYVPPWPLPKIFRLVKNGKLIEGIFSGETINTPSMLCVEDYLDALQWAKSVGGLDRLIARANSNAKVLEDWVKRTPWVDFLAKAPETRSNTSVCLKIVDPQIAAWGPDDQARFAKALASVLEQERVAFDIGAYRDAPPGLRIWCGATVEAADLEVLTRWLDYAYAKTKRDLASAN